MSPDVAVSARGVGKQYRLGQLTGGYQLLTETIAERLAIMRGAAEKAPEEEFWAVRDIDFDVERGETFGIIGHNGAGKSTLLKILSRVTPPTTGEISLHGRVGALLEVGTGFHPELTGRENVFLNGAILGMTRVEILSKFEEIVEFAGVERFLDTPVKRYSSGMQLRLAFSVAAHLEPEILVVDEVLSVGDLAFQQKCLGRIETVAGEGRTILFVSHNLSAVQNLCRRSMLLSAGRTVAHGATEDVIQEYIRGVKAGAGIQLDERTDRQGSGELRFSEVSFESQGQVVDAPSTGQDLDIVLSYETLDGKPLRNVNVATSISTHIGQVMLWLSSETTGTQFPELPPSGTVRCHIPRCPLPAGEYVLTLWADRNGEPIDWVQRACELTITQGDFFGSGQAQSPGHRSVLIDHEWYLADEPVTGSATPAGSGTAPGP
jgi:lipopolysaccharide transport system ATP-binding protein